MIFFESAEALRDWFDAHHATAAELWVGYHKVATGRPSLRWSDAVDEALCVGWIDGVRYSLGPDAHAQRFTPRRAGSIWSAVNVGKVGELTAAGRMRPAGLAAFAARRPERTAVYSHERPTAALSDDELATFQAVPDAWAAWERVAPSYRRQAIHWVTSAKRRETRAKRLGELIAAAGRGERPGPFRVARRA